MPRSIDIAIVTVIPEERDAVAQLLEGAQWHQTELLPNLYAWTQGTIRNAAGDTYRVALGCAGGPGNTAGALVTDDAIERWNPRYVLLVGIGGGIKSGLKLGDVVVSSRIWAYEYGKIEAGHFVPRRHYEYAPDQALLNAATYRASAWSAPAFMPGAAPANAAPGVIGSGDKLVDDTSYPLVQSILVANPELAAVEMEGGGAGASIEQARNRGKVIGFLMIRGISDIPPNGVGAAGSQKAQRDQTKRLAAQNAASFAVDLIKNAWPVSPNKTSLSPSVSAAPALDKYHPYPTELVDELERLTKERARPRVGEISNDSEVRKKRISELVRDLRAFDARLSDATILGVRLNKFLGAGNFGAVWAGTNKAGEERAVKVFEPNRFGDSLAMYRFRRGVVAMKHLNDAGSRPSEIVRLFEVEENRLAFSMEYVPGHDLERTTPRERGWQLSKKLEVFKSICKAVGFAHANKIIHRDIKPANILMRLDGTPVLTDFDIADLQFAKTLTAHEASGLYGYAAPEQLQGNVEGEPSADIFSLGRILQYLLLEKTPEFLYEDVPVLAEMRGQPQGLVRIIRKCTMKAPRHRYQRIDDLLEDLQKYDKSPRRVGASVSGPPPVVAGLLLTLVGAALAAVVVVAGSQLKHRNREYPQGESVAAGSLAPTESDASAPERDPDEALTTVPLDKAMRLIVESEPAVKETLRVWGEKIEPYKFLKYPDVMKYCGGHVGFQALDWRVGPGRCDVGHKQYEDLNKAFARIGARMRKQLELRHIALKEYVSSHVRIRSIR